MTSLTAAEALSAAERQMTPAPALRHLAAVNGSERPDAVNPRCTPRVSWLPCAGGCGGEYHGGKRDGSGKCRACYLKDLGSDGRKTEPEEQFAMLGRMIRSTARRAEGEDPGRGLKLLLEHEKFVRELIRQVGPSMVAQYGQTVVAAELGTSKQNVDKRWGSGTA
jgi:hypothetical protein